MKKTRKHSYIYIAKRANGEMETVHAPNKNKAREKLAEMNFPAVSLQRAFHRDGRLGRQVLNKGEIFCAEMFGMTLSRVETNR